MNTLKQDYEITAPVEKVWQSLTDAELMSQWSGDPAESDPQEGGAFSLWAGDIHGMYTKLVPNQLIEQDWYGHDNPTWKYTVRFSLSPVNNGTKVHMVYSGDIVDRDKDIADWREYYFDPIKKLLEEKS